MDSLFHLSTQLVDDLCALRPISATFMGVPGHDHRWDDLSPEGACVQAHCFERWRCRLLAVPPPDSRWDRLALHVMLDWLTLELEGLRNRDGEVDLNSLASPPQMLRMVFDSMDLSDAVGWENVITRLETLGSALEGYQRSLMAGRDAGRTVARRQVEAVMREAEIHAGPSSYFRTLPARYPGPASSRLWAAVQSACECYHAFGRWLGSCYLPHATIEDGVGEAAYRRAVRRWVGSDVDLREAYAWGWEEIRRIQARMERLSNDLFPGLPLPEALQRLNEDPVAPDAESFRIFLENRQKLALTALDGTHFDVPPLVRRIDVKLAPPSGRPGAYYCPPSENFSRAGAVWYSLVGDGPFPLFDEVSTAYHEGFPGHHLQVGVQVSLTGSLCRLHRVAYGYSGYSEGWALYAEQLIGELGYYENSAFELGMLANQMIRAARVVIDIGAHLRLPIPDTSVFHPRSNWSFELAVTMLQELGGSNRVTAESEITRYLGWPAQAISYKLGQRAILSLREEFRQRHGNDLKEFHTRVLGSGNVNLDLLRLLVLDPEQALGAG